MPHVSSPCEAGGGEGAALCRACGLCCDGTLFTRVPLGVHEAAAPGLDVRVTEGGGRYVPQRCAALNEGGCTVYASRPRACAQFECLLFGALREGEVSLAEALQVVRGAREVAPGERSEYLRFHFGRR